MNYVGTDLIVTDGNTLLGADDKAGIAEILTAMEYSGSTSGNQAWTYSSLFCAGRGNRGRC